MVMSPGLRKLALTAHVTTSVGWLGAVAAFLALAIAGLFSADPLTGRAAYLAIDLTAWFVIVPLSFASPLTGFIQSLGTPWGLFRQYWVVMKLIITIPSTALLLVHMGPIGRMRAMAAAMPISAADLHGMRTQLVIEAAVALAVLLLATALSVIKPEGVTPHGARRLQARGLPPVRA